jgi:hypothetical protein
VNVKRIERRDRPWLNSYVAAICGPFAMPPADTVRAAVRSLTDRHPHSRLGWRLDAGGHRWITGGDSDGLVVGRDWEPGEHVAGVLDAIATDDRLREPLALIRYPEFLGLRMSHSIGDGHMFNTIFSAVLGTALSGGPYPWDAHPRGRFPLGQAIVRTFGKRPSLVRAAVTDRPPLAEAQAAGRPQPWKPARRTAFASIPAADMDDIVARAKQSTPGVTRAAVQMWVLLRSLRRCGLAIAPDVNLIVDLRRYLGPPPIDGNFVAGVPLRVDPALSLTELSATIRATMTSGRPLATGALTTLRRGRPPPPPDTVDPAAPVRVTFSGMGRPPEIAGLPFLPGRPAVYTGGVEPDGPTGLTLLISETPATVAITASFHDNVIDATVVTDALRLATSDPIGVLSEAIVTS